MSELVLEPRSPTTVLPFSLILVRTESKMNQTLRVLQRGGPPRALG